MKVSGRLEVDTAASPENMEPAVIAVRAPSVEAVRAAVVESWMDGVELLVKAEAVEAVDWRSLGEVMAAAL